jgi:hypothetical protein
VLQAGSISRSRGKIVVQSWSCFPLTLCTNRATLRLRNTGIFAGKLIVGLIVGLAGEIEVPVLGYLRWLEGKLRVP